MLQAHRHPDEQLHKQETLSLTISVVNPCGCLEYRMQ
jgi:hypothetical protein